MIVGKNVKNCIVLCGIIINFRFWQCFQQIGSPILTKSISFLMLEPENVQLSLKRIKSKLNKNLYVCL